VTAAPDPTSTPSVRQRLAHAAAQLFEAHGYEETTVDQIASQAGVGRRTFFRYYRSKEDVIFPDHDALLVTVRERLWLIPAESGIQAATDAVKLVLRHYVDTREISLLRYRLVSQVPALREREIVSVARYQRVFRERLSEGSDGSATATLRAELAAAAIAAAHNQVLRHWLRGNGETDPFPELEQALHYVADMFDQPQQHPLGAASNDVIVLAFPSSTPTETLVAELTRARPTSAPQGATPKDERTTSELS
jgi:AcrR family transcriptional regulator